MPLFVVFLVNTLTAVILLAFPSSDRLLRAVGQRSAGLAALPLVDAALLSAYVFGEDSYRDNGTSRWDAYRSPGGALGPMFVASVALMVACAALLAYFALRGRRRSFRSAALLGGLTALSLLTATIVGFTAD
jgi:hypothetical protein